MKESPKLQIKIDNKADVELFEFASSMASINNEYHRYIAQNTDKKSRGDCRLYVNRVANGSIIVDLCERAPELLPVITPLIVEYSSFLTQTIDYLCGKTKTLPAYKFAKDDFLNIKKILEPVANVTGNSVSLEILNFKKETTVNVTYNFTEASAAQNQCTKEIQRLERSGDSLIKENVDLQLYQARNAALSVSTLGNLGIIDDVSDKPIVLSFATDRLRYDIAQFDQNPLNYVFRVDAEVKLKDGSLFLESYKDIKEYEILKLHAPIARKDLFD